MRPRSCAFGWAALLVAASFGAIGSPRHALATECVTGKVEVEPSDQPNLGAYLYHVWVDWGPLSHGLFHIDLRLNVLPCLDPCGEPPLFAFPDTAARSTGEWNESSCWVYYSGELLCGGDPSTGTPGPLLKYEPLPGQTCEPGEQGTALLYFYSNLAPGPETEWSDALIVKFGSQIPCTGHVEGPLPHCPPTETENSTWGGIKSLYR